MVEPPQNPNRWLMLAKEYGVESKSIFELGKLESGSKVKERQFLALRVLWKMNEADKLDSWGLEKTLARGHLQQTNDWNNYTGRFETGEEGFRGMPYLGTFDMLWKYQRLVNGLELDGPELNKVATGRAVTRSMTNQAALTRARASENESPSRGRGKNPSTPKNQNLSLGDLVEETESLSLSNSDPADETPFLIPKETPFSVARFGDLGDYSEGFAPVEDEQIVNTALILLLEGVCLRAPGVDEVEWTLQRKSFNLKNEEEKKDEATDKKRGKAKEKGKEEKKKTEIFQARTDGHLRIKLGGESKSLAILEVKARLRSVGKPFMQESAQMAAWIHAEPDVGNKTGEFKRTMICQDHHEIYIIIATYDWKYLEYITTGVDPAGKPSFLTMHQFGPFIPNKSGNMKKLGTIILALSQQLQKYAMAGQPCHW